MKFVPAITTCHSIDRLNLKQWHALYRYRLCIKLFNKYFWFEFHKKNVNTQHTQKTVRITWHTSGECRLYKYVFTGPGSVLSLHKFSLKDLLNELVENLHFTLFKYSSWYRLSSKKVWIYQNMMPNFFKNQC